MDFSRLRQGEIVAGLAGIALIVCMFLPWYGLGVDVPEVEIPDVPGIDQGALPEVPEVDDDASGWDALTDFDGFLIALAAVAGIALAALAGAGRRLNLGDLPRGAGTALLGALAVALIVWRIFAQPTPGADLEYGIFLALASAIALTVGALMSLREGGFEPLVATAGAGRPATSGATTTRRATSTRRSSGGSRSSSSSRGRSGAGRKKS